MGLELYLIKGQMYVNMSLCISYLPAHFIVAKPTIASKKSKKNNIFHTIELKREERKKKNVKVITRRLT